MADRKGALSVLIGIHKKPNRGMDSPPPKYPSNPAVTGAGDDAGPPPPPGIGGAPGGEDEPEADEASEKAAPERALYAGPEETCGTCEYWQSPNSCSKVDVVTDKNGRCYAFYEPKSGGANVGAGGMPMMPMPEEAGGGGISG